MEEVFENRTEAGKKLATRLQQYANQDDVIVLALPRGGVPVGYEVAHALNVPLEVLLVRKLGVPGHEELAMGAIASRGTTFLNDSIVDSLRISQETIDNVIKKETRELQKREVIYQGERPNIDIQGKIAIVVDDGLATGATMWAAVHALSQMQLQAVVVAVPTAPPEVVSNLEDHVDEVVALITPVPFGGVGRWYREFSQTTNEEVIQYLRDQPERVI